MADQVENGFGVLHSRNLDQDAVALDAHFGLADALSVDALFDDRAGFFQRTFSNFADRLHLHRSTAPEVKAQARIPTVKQRDDETEGRHRQDHRQGQSISGLHWFLQSRLGPAQPRQSSALRSASLRMVDAAGRSTTSRAA